MKFYLGTDNPSWLGRVGVPLFVSHRRLQRQRTWPRAIAPWALDSGGFTELTKYGEWRTTPEEYVEAIAIYVERIGNLEWCAPQDWMCEPHMLDRTGRSVLEHQELTVENLVRLRALNPAAPIIPVLQGWAIPDYLRHVTMYEAAGIDLAAEPLVGLGTVCRRQHTSEAAALVARIASLGLKLHGFGLKMSAVDGVGDLLASADSMAWSYNARRNERLPECTHKAMKCAHCETWALRWRSRLLAGATRPRARQGQLPWD